MSVDVFATVDDVHHHLDGLDQPRVTMPLARYHELLAIEAAGGAHELIERLRRIEAAALVHIDACHVLCLADGAYAEKHPTIAARGAAMDALLIARGGVVDTSAALAQAVGR